MQYPSRGARYSADDDGSDDNDDEEHNRFHPDIHLLSIVVARDATSQAGTPQEVGRNTDAETSAEKNVGIQVVDSETIREYRLMGFNDLRTLVRSDLGVSSYIVPCRSRQAVYLSPIDYPRPRR